MAGLGSRPPEALPPSLELVRRTARYAVGASLVTAPLTFWGAGFGPALLVLATAVPNGIILLAFGLGYRRGIVEGFIAVQSLLVLLLFVTTGGLSGAFTVFFVVLPMLPTLLVTPRRLAYVASALVVTGVLSVAYAVDVGWVSSLDPAVAESGWLRMLNTVLAIFGSGITAAAAMNNLQAAIDDAVAEEQRARAAVEQKKSFLANISHELRTPMNAILGYSELILEESTDELTARDVRSMHEAGQRLLDLINDVLHLARVDAGETTMDLRRHPADGMARELTQLLRAKHPTAAVTVAPAAPTAFLFTDVQRLRHVLNHIVDGLPVDEAVALSIDVDASSVRFTFAIPPRDPETPRPLGWLLAERIAEQLDATFVQHLTPHHAVELRVPRRARELSTATHVRNARTHTWRTGSPDPLDAVRTELGERLAAMWVALLLLVAAIETLAFGPLPVHLLGQGLGVAFCVLLLGLFARGHGRFARGIVPSASALAITLAMVVDGGFSGSIALYLPALPAMGAMLLGPRGGLVAAGVAAGLAITVWAVGDLIGGGSPSVDPRFDAAMHGALAALLTGSVVGLASAPLRRAADTAAGAAHRAQLADSAASHFLGAVSHELRTPLHVILGYSEMLLEDCDESSRRRDLHRIVHAGQHLRSVVDDLLDMSTIESGELALSPETVDLTVLIEQVGAVVGPAVRRRRNRLTSDIHPQAEHVTADLKRLRQILLNLLSNAAKFTQNGSITVRVRLAEPGQVVVKVEDTGIGIASDDLTTLFEPFRQAHAGRPGEFGGTGLGLTISRRLARLMDGDLVAESTLGVGSTFVLTLPAGPDLDDVGHRRDLTSIRERR